MSASVLHLIPSLSPGGAGRAALMTATIGAEAGQRPLIASIRAAHPWMAEEADERDIELLDAPTTDDLIDVIAAADLVQLHHWSTPELIELFERELPEMRLLVWPHVSGATSPQLLPTGLISGADATIASSELNHGVITSALGAARDIPTIPPIGGWDSLGPIGPHRTDDACTIGYVGTVSFVKLAPEFAELCARIDAPTARFVVCGAGDASASLPEEMERLGLGGRFEFHDHRREIGPLLAEIDVLGFPVCAGSSGSSDLVVKEAMYAGVPPVVLARAGCADLVDDGRTDLVASDLDGYVTAVERLAADPDLRRSLGVAAAEEARRRWDPEVIAPLWLETWDRALSLPKRGRPPLLAPPAGPRPGAERLLRGLGSEAELFRTSLSDDEPAALAADRGIAHLSAPIGLNEGGILDHARRYSADSMLALWSGLFIGTHGHRGLAAVSLSKAKALGCPAVRVDPHLEVLAA
jgi:glycosyltransferase involved in cell wall biosynthesis